MAYLVNISVLVDDKVQSIETTQKLAPEAIAGILSEKCVLDVQWNIQKIEPKMDSEPIELRRRRRSRSPIGEAS